MGGGGVEPRGEGRAGTGIGCVPKWPPRSGAVIAADGAGVAITTAGGAGLTAGGVEGGGGGSAETLVTGAGRGDIETCGTGGAFGIAAITAVRIRDITSAGSGGGATEPRAGGGVDGFGGGVDGFGGGGAWDACLLVGGAGTGRAGATLRGGGLPGGPGSDFFGTVISSQPSSSTTSSIGSGSIDSSSVSPCVRPLRSGAARVPPVPAPPALPPLVLTARVYEARRESDSVARFDLCYPLLMTHTVNDLVAAMEAIAPLRLAESWDNVGLLVGDREAPVSRVLFCIDYTDAVADEAEDRGVSAVVAYHPPIFKGLTRLVAGTPVVRAVTRGIAIYAPHTALDVALGGTNDVLADLLGLVDRSPIQPHASGGGLGMGRIGDLPEASVSDLCARAARGLGLSHVLVAGPREGSVARAAVGAGSCGGLFADAARLGATFFLTGEIRHHDALAAARLGLTVVAALHSNSERITLRRLADRVGAALPGVECLSSERDEDPFRVVTL